MVKNILQILFVFILYTRPVFSEKQFYIYPDYTGSVHTGSMSEPFVYLDENAWNKINLSLSNENVTIFFSSRKASGDQDEIYDKDSDGKPREIDVCNKNPKTVFTLTFNGKSLYYTNEAIPKWALYKGPSLCKVAGFNSQNKNHEKFSHVVIEGFNIEKSGDGKALAICGDYWTVKNCDIRHGRTANNGPLVYIVPTADGNFEGSSYYAPACHAISIENNVIHDSNGELIYIGAGACSKSDPTGTVACMGFPSHSDVVVRNNRLYNGGVFGGQGDGIDCKAGISNLVISGNEIFNISSPGARAIVLEGQCITGPTQNIVIESNYIHNCTHQEDAAIALANSWGTPKGVLIRNNIIANNDAIGIKIYDGDAIEIINNTIFKNRSFGIWVSTGAVDILNNLLIENNGGSAQASLNGTIQSSHNGFSSARGAGSCGNCITQCSSSDLSDATLGHFWLKPGAPEIDKGMDVPEASKDFLGNKRISPYDIGAFEYSSSGMLNK